MGNSNNSRTPSGAEIATCPRTLGDFLTSAVADRKATQRVMKARSSSDCRSGLDCFFASNPCGQKLLGYLRDRELNEDELIVKFLILAKLCLKGHPSEKVQRVIFQYIIETFFSEDSPETIPLSNQVLFERLSSYRGAMTLNREMLDHLRRAMNDPSVWSDGFEPTYMAFLDHVASQGGLIACLLSIL